MLRSKHIAQARLVLQHIMELPIKILNQPVPKHIKKGDTRGTENMGNGQQIHALAECWSG